MKISFFFLGLVANYAAFVSADGAGNKIDTTIPLYSKLTSSCLDEIKESSIYNECLFSVGFHDIGNLRDDCKKAFSDKCKTFFEDPISSLPKCKNDTVMMEYNEYLKDIALDINTFYCSVNEENNTCPSALFIIENPNDYSERFMEDCPFKICLDKQIQYLENQKKYSSFNNKYFINDSSYDETADKRYYDYIINKLKTQECTSQIKNNSTTNTTKLITEIPENTSDAASIKVFSFLLSFLLVYVFFY